MWLLTSFLFVCLRLVPVVVARNSTYTNPILPGFHPDPSCIFVDVWDHTFFCASSSFLAFPGIPIHASKNLQSWNLISNALNRQEQLPMLANVSGQTSGIWAPTLRYHKGVFYLVTTLVYDDKDFADASRWDNIIFKTDNPYDPRSWSNATHFGSEGYDPSLFWDDDGQVYVSTAHPWQVWPGINQATIDLETGEVGAPINVWNGTGGLAPEGPHIYKKDGYYYLMIAEGGTFLDHMVTIARSRSINGPYEANPENPILTNANTTEYFQAVGHADLLQDGEGNWWGVALSMRLDLSNLASPMGRETVLFPVEWGSGNWPLPSRIQGNMTGWSPPSRTAAASLVDQSITSPDVVDFIPGSKLPEHFGHWRLPQGDSYTVSPSDHPYSLRLRCSSLNLSSSDGDSLRGSQTLLARRQVHTLFIYSVDMEFSPQQLEEEAGVTLFATGSNHMDLGIVLLPSPNATAYSAPYFRFRAYGRTASTTVLAGIPDEWRYQNVRMEIKALNGTHYAFSAGPAAHQSRMQTVAYAPGNILRSPFTGAFVGVYATTNGGNGTTDAFVRRWRYQGEGQYID